MSQPPHANPAACHKAVSDFYHGYVMGLILAAVTHRSVAEAEKMIFRLFRRQQLEKFLPGLEKLGLTGLPDAVACAQYHYFSNSLGGVKVEFIPENDRKAWVRYPPPRWIFHGAVICGIPGEVNRAMLRSWHSNNGVVLGNPRLGYVCTGQTVEGDPGLEGYFMEYDHELSPGERLRFAPDESAPPFDPARAPELPHDTWPEERMRKAMRNYTMEYIRNLYQVMPGIFGVEGSVELAGRAARLTGLHFYHQTAEELGIEGDSPEAFAAWLAAMGQGQGDDTAWEANSAGPLIRQTGWRLLAGQEVVVPPPLFTAWNALWEGALGAHNRHLRLEVTQPPSGNNGPIQWRVRG